MKWFQWWIMQCWVIMFALPACILNGDAVLRNIRQQENLWQVDCQVSACTAPLLYLGVVLSPYPLSVNPWGPHSAFMYYLCVVRMCECSSVQWFDSAVFMHHDDTRAYIHSQRVCMMHKCRARELLAGAVLVHNNDKWTWTLRHHSILKGLKGMRRMLHRYCVNNHTW